MVRSYTVKGLKRKKREEEYDKEEDETIAKKNKVAVGEEEERKAEEAMHELPGIPIVPSNQNAKPGVIVVLERASLEFDKVGKVNICQF